MKIHIFNEPNKTFTMPNKNYSPGFDDTKLPENKLSAERMLEIEKKAKPHMDEAMKKLKKMYPDGAK